MCTLLICGEIQCLRREGRTSFNDGNACPSRYSRVAVSNSTGDLTGASLVPTYAGFWSHMLLCKKESANL
jgi:hypothetical protein